MESLAAMYTEAPSLADPLRRLLERAAAGDEKALTELYDATSSRVYGLAVKVLRDRDLAQDATLQVYTQVWQQSRRYDAARGNVLGWLLTLARSRSIDLLRSRQRLQAREQAIDEIASFVDPAPDAHAAAVERERGRLLRQAVGGLPEEQRRAIEVAFFAGLSHREAAKALGQPLGTVKTRIRRGLIALRESLAGAEERMA